MLASPTRRGDIRRTSSARLIVDGPIDAHGSQAVDAKRHRDLAGASPRGQLQEDPRPLDMVGRRCARAGQFGQRPPHIVGQANSHVS